MFVKTVVPLLVVCMAVASARFLEGWKDADMNSEEVQEALRFAINEYNARTNSEYYSEFVKVIKAQTQLVTGVVYTFTVNMVKPSCRTVETDIMCSITDPAIGQERKCTLTVWSRPWENPSLKLVKYTC